MNWLERARCEIQKSAQRPTANSAERNPTAAMAVPHPALREKSGASIGSNGSAPSGLSPAMEPENESLACSDELLALVDRVANAHHFTDEELQEAKSRALADREAALECFTAIVAETIQLLGDPHDTPRSTRRR